MWELIGHGARWSLFVGLLLAFGAVVFKVVLLRRPDPTGAPSAYDPRATAARVGFCGVLLAALGAAGRVASEMAVFRDPFESYTAELQLLLTATSFGTAWIGQAVFVLLCAVAFGLAAYGPRSLAEPGWFGAAAFVVLLSYTPAFSGHAAGSEHYTTMAISADVFHVMAGGAWLGTLAVMATVVRSARRADAPIGPARIVDWLEAFSPIALGAAVTLAVTGLFGAWLHLDAISSLWSHPYGRTLSLKLILLGGVLACGAYNWKRSRDRVEASGETPRLPPTVALELALGLALLLVTAVLVTTQPPEH